MSSGMFGMHLLPPWLEAPLMRLRSTSEHGEFLRWTTPQKYDREVAEPEGVLAQQLKNVDVVHEPMKAYTLHAAMGKLLQNSAGKGEKVLQHLEHARDAATRGNDPDALMAAHLDLAEAYINEGRAVDSQRELVVAARIMPDHFAEHSVKLNRMRGLAKFELGHPVSALRYFEMAARTASNPEDVVRLACDSAMAQTCLGHARKSLEPLRWALEVLQAAGKQSDEIMDDHEIPTATHNALAAEVHLRLAEAFHYIASASNGDADADVDVDSAASAEAHYKKALHLQSKSSNFKPLLVSEIKNGLARLDQNLGQDIQGVLKPSLHCPSHQVAPWDQPTNVQPTNAEVSELTTRINELWAQDKYDLAVSEIKATLRGQPRPYSSLQAAAALNMLGETYRMQGSFSDAVKNFRQALYAVTACGVASGDAGSQAEKAYKGLKDLNSHVSLAEQRVVIAALHVYGEKAAKLGLPIVHTDEDPVPASAHSILLL